MADSLDFHEVTTDTINQQTRQNVTLIIYWPREHEFKHWLHLVARHGTSIAFAKSEKRHDCTSSLVASVWYTKGDVKSRTMYIS